MAGAEKSGETTAKLGGPKSSGTSTKALGTRTLMSFRGCALQLGCTVVLKGASAHQLGLVKTVLKVCSCQLMPSGSYIRKLEENNAENFRSLCWLSNTGALTPFPDPFLAGVQAAMGKDV